MLYVTHARAEVDFLADRVLLMDRGRLAPETRASTTAHA
jgi:ABC-type molybdate transport system ATPase subunit